MNLLDLSDELLKKIFSYTEIGEEIDKKHGLTMRKNLFINKFLFKINLKLFCDINKERRKKGFKLRDKKNLAIY